MDFSGWEKLSLVDYPEKICVTLFTAGCNFRCPFCHNKALVIEGANQPTIPFEEIIDYLSKRSKVLDAVCITGGEATLLPDLAEKIKVIKELGYEVKLDTNGTNPKLLKELIDKKLIDYCAMDIKSSFSGYFKAIGKSFDLDSIKESICVLMENKIPYEFRTTLVEELHTEDDIIEMSELLKGANKLYLQHFVDRGTCIVENLHEIEKEKALKYKCLLEKTIKSVELRGY